MPADPELLLSFVPCPVEIDVDSQGGRKHRRGEILGIVAELLLLDSEVVMLGYISVTLPVFRDGNTDRCP